MIHPTKARNLVQSIGILPSYFAQLTVEEAKDYMNRYKRFVSNPLISEQKYEKLKDVNGIFDEINDIGVETILKALKQKSTVRAREDELQARLEAAKNKLFVDVQELTEKFQFGTHYFNLIDNFAEKEFILSRPSKLYEGTKTLTLTDLLAEENLFPTIKQHFEKKANIQADQLGDHVRQLSQKISNNDGYISTEKNELHYFSTLKSLINKTYEIQIDRLRSDYLNFRAVLMTNPGFRSKLERRMSNIRRRLDENELILADRRKAAKNGDEISLAGHLEPIQGFYNYYKDLDLFESVDPPKGFLASTPMLERIGKLENILRSMNSYKKVLAERKKEKQAAQQFIDAYSTKGISDKKEIRALEKKRESAQMKAQKPLPLNPFSESLQQVIDHYDQTIAEYGLQKENVENQVLKKQNLIKHLRALDLKSSKEFTADLVNLVGISFSDLIKDVYISLPDLYRRMLLAREYGIQDGVPRLDPLVLIRVEKDLTISYAPINAFASLPKELIKTDRRLIGFMLPSQAYIAPSASSINFKQIEGRHRNDDSLLSPELTNKMSFMQSLVADINSSDISFKYQMITTEMKDKYNVLRSDGQIASTPVTHRQNMKSFELSRTRNALGLGETFTVPDE